MNTNRTNTTVTILDADALCTLSGGVNAHGYPQWPGTQTAVPITLPNYGRFGWPGTQTASPSTLHIGPPLAGE